MPNKKKKNSNIVLDFVRGYLARPDNKSKASTIVRAAEKRNAALKKLGPDRLQPYVHPSGRRPLTPVKGGKVFGVSHVSNCTEKRNRPDLSGRCLRCQAQCRIKVTKHKRP